VILAHSVSTNRSGKELMPSGLLLQYASGDYTEMMLEKGEIHQ
jgi:hypothetical protein